MRRVLRRIAATGAAALALSTGALRAQGTPAELRPARDTTIETDRVVAVVGNRPVLLSQVDEEIFTRESQQHLAPPTTDAGLDSLRRAIVSDIIDDELIVQEAQRDTTIKVTDEEVVQGVDQQVKSVRARFTSEVDYANELRKAGFQTPDEYRRWTADNIRRTFYKNRYLEHLKDRGRLKPIIPTERELRAYYERTHAAMDKLPPTISFRQIVIAPKPAAAAKARSKALADSIVAELRKGADFATAARRFSQDPGSKDQGGDLGWQRRGTFLTEFERAEYALKPGMISEPVETAFGFHIIQVVRTQPTETNARHILIVPAVTPADVDSAHAQADRIVVALRAGASFDSLQKLYHDQSEEKEGLAVPVDKVPPVYAAGIGTADSGAVTAAFDITGPDGRTKFAIVKVTARRDAGEMTYDEAKNSLRTALAEQNAVRRLIARLRGSSYIDVRGP